MFAQYATALGLLYVLPRPNANLFMMALNVIFGLRMYVLRRKEDCKKVLKHITYRHTFTERGEAYGLSFNVKKGFLTCIDISGSDYGDTYSGWLVCTKETYDSLMGDDQHVEVVVPAQLQVESFSIIEKISSCHRNIYFRKRPIKQRFESKDSQLEIVKAIERHYIKHGRAVCFISGPPGQGKSMVGILVAQQLRGLYCNTFKPWSPGESLSALHTDAEPTVDKPLIISLDDFDVGLSAILEKEPSSEEYTIEIYNKDSWNTFFDNIERHLYPNIIILLTTNKTIQDLEATWCKSLLRSGRISLYFSLNTFATQFDHV